MKGFVRFLYARQILDNLLSHGTNKADRQCLPQMRIPPEGWLLLYRENSKEER